MRHKSPFSDLPDIRIPAAVLDDPRRVADFMLGFQHGYERLRQHLH